MNTDESAADERIAPELARWIDEFRAQHGRPPRMLHIGNIANNAYNNARLLNQLGLDCDVICHNYYHVMGCPEWEDADFSGDIRNDFFPAWERVRLNGFQRPRWFAQAPLHMCWSYLLARRRGDERGARYWWRRMAIQRVIVGLSARNPLLEHARQFARKYRSTIRQASHGIRSLPDAWQHLKSRLRAWAAGFKSSSPIGGAIFHAGMIVWLTSQMVALIVVGPFLLMRWMGTYPIEQQLEPVHKIYLVGTWLFHVLLLGWRLVQSALQLIFLPLLLLVALIRMRPRRQVTAPVEHRVPFDLMIAQLIRQFREAFPDRGDALKPVDIEPYRSVVGRWSELFACYDMVLGYSTDPILPMLSGVPYLALEHGTLREIPFQPTPTGRLTALAYHLAEHVFVTNSDCYEKGRLLAGDKVTFLNHPFDDDHFRLVQNVEQTRSQLCQQLSVEHLIFFPTRHDWVPGTGYADKGNDKFLRAYAKLVHEGLRVGLVCCDWGKNVAQSRALLKELQADRHVRWIKPLGMVPFERLALACGLVADQFHLGSFGGIMLKAMAAGVPVITYLDETAVLARFQSIPPVLNAATVDDISHGLAELMTHPERLTRLGRQSREWIKQHYSTRETLNKQLAVLQSLLQLRNSSALTTSTETPSALRHAA